MIGLYRDKIIKLCRINSLKVLSMGRQLVLLETFSHLRVLLEIEKILTNKSTKTHLKMLHQILSMRAGVLKMTEIQSNLIFEGLNQI